MRLTLLITICLLASCTVHAQPFAREDDPAPLHRAQRALTAVIIHDIFSPPVASRIYAYANIAAYEVLRRNDPSFRSLESQLQSFPAIPAPPKNISLSLAAIQAFLQTGRTFIFSEKLLQDSTDTVLRWYTGKGLTPQQMAASVAYGKQVAAAVSSWAAADRYRETRSLRRYNFSRQEGRWIPTPPVYMAAIEPYWNRIRTLVLDSAGQFKPATAPAFSKDTASSFYNQAMEVYTAGRDMTSEQRAIASFWDCNPFAVTSDGHLNFAAKKISPGGHWISIAGLAAQKVRANIRATAAAYTLTALSLFEGFIICWDEKYRSNVIRPETYINKYIDEAWRPLLQTPPFPEYTSGHSVVSTAAATVLTHLFGDSFSYADDTEVDFGLPVRQFNSFAAACDEASLSRLYGGIHYRAAIVEGQKQGKQLGDLIVGKIILNQQPLAATK